MSPAGGSPGTVWLVGTPIGNRADLAPRAREVLGRVGLVACEDTRTCRALFSWMGVPTPELVAYHDHNAEAVLPGLLARVEAGEDLALVSEAGMPAIQDPGYRLVVASRRARIEVVPIPGPSALILALAASGLPTDRFAFLGFAPRRGRRAWWADALLRAETVVVYEAPTRVQVTLEAIEVAAPARAVCLAREITKVHEEFVTGSARAVADQLAARGERLRGECVIVVAGTGEGPAGRPRPWREALGELRRDRTGSALSGRGLVDVLACVYPAERNAIYRAVQEETDE
ncbi:MAG TPA: 16S rRNA (cytidine(1402)-2'-O)-methyltransferase [Gemmatimonadota bacterium]|nr:16S rRNA (cytidine(1402)-2'-O)-methyltransferase [Gemmatimonadota bacterium]